ncbi:MAG: BamA/TamA family outer membrane protein [Spirochaetes bacterium]|nr:BamA/TamA family outer membrane protein [Spirochaetota bacterium]
MRFTGRGAVRGKGILARINAAFIAVAIIGAAAAGLRAEEQKDLYEGITESYGSDFRLGVLPRFKLNPETGFGSGLKLKAANPLGAPVMLELSNLYTTTRYEQYEAAAIVPPLRGNDGGPYAILYAGYDRIPDMRVFGVGNDTRDGAGEDEATLRYKGASSRLTAGWSFMGRYFCALHALYRRVWTGEGIADDMVQAEDKFAALPGIDGGATPGFGFSLIRATRDSQWRPRGGTRLEISAEQVPRQWNGDFAYRTVVADARACRNLFGGYNVLAARVRVQRVFGDGDAIPWWALSSVGGRDSLRGYWDGRFRDRASALANAEFRFHIVDVSFGLWRFRPAFILDGTLFADAGRVFGEEDDTVTAGWKYTGGAGLRLVTGPNLVGRFDIGFSREQTAALYFNFGTVF